MSATLNIDRESLLAATRHADEPQWLRDSRAAGMNTFLDLGFPEPHDENWKYTNARPLAAYSTKWLENGAPQGCDAVAAYAAFHQAKELLGDLDAYTLLFVNGRAQNDWLSLSLPEGISLHRLRSTGEAPPGGVTNPGPFQALNQAVHSDSLELKLEETSILDKPLYVLYIAVPGENVLICPRLVITAGHYSRATVVEHYFGLNDDQQFTNAVTEIHQQSHSDVAHYRIQQQSENSLHVARLDCTLDEGAQLSLQNLDAGGALVRNDLVARLQGPDAALNMRGVYFGHSSQHIDNHTRVDHLAPDCRSDQDYRGIVTGNSRCVFNGKVVVHEGADGTDASQSNANLMLSDDAEIDTKPELEIYADDVKCSHGATIGQISDDELFYLRSRGIEQQDARNILTFAFARAVLGDSRAPQLRRKLEDILAACMPQLDDIEGLL